MTGFAGSAALAFVLGLRHGLDADHLAVVDGLTRWNAGERRAFAPWCGVLFSAGHGAIVLAVAMALALAAAQWQPPEWLVPAGALLSAITLLLLSAVNLRIALEGPGDRRAVGLRARLFAPLLRAPRSWQVVLLGALFALSFDAVALAALFATSASVSGGTLGVGSVALAFATGMAVVGAANGLWVVRLLKHSDNASRQASRFMTLTIALVGFGIGAGVLLALAVEPVEQWVSTNEIIVSASVVTLVLAGYVCALVLASRARRAHVSA